MSNKEDIETFLNLLDPGMGQFAPNFITFGVKDASQLKFMCPDDVDQIVNLNVIQKRMILAEIMKRQTPNSKAVSSFTMKGTQKPLKKTLFPEETDQSDSDEEYIPGEFRWNSPVDSAIEAVENEISMKKVELESAEDHLKKLQALYPLVPHSTKQQCSNCHLRGDHTRRTCEVKMIFSL